MFFGSKLNVVSLVQSFRFVITLRTGAPCNHACILKPKHWLRWETKSWLAIILSFLLYDTLPAKFKISWFIWHQICCLYWQIYIGLISVLTGILAQENDDLVKLRFMNEASRSIINCYHTISRNRKKHTWSSLNPVEIWAYL